MNRTERSQLLISASRWRVLVLLLASALLLALGGSPAVAAQEHAFAGSFGSPGSGAGQFGFTSESGLAVDQSDGDVYVADTANHRVEKFSPTGAFLFAFGWGVKAGDTASAGLDTCTTATGCQAGFPGHEPGQFEEPTFIAVDNTPGGEGDVYVANQGTGANERETLTVSATGGTYTLSFTAPVSGTTTTGSSLVVVKAFGASGPYEPGDAISGPGIPPGATIVRQAVSSNREFDEWELSAGATASGAAVFAVTGATSPIAFHAPAQGAGSVQAALEALRAIGEENVSVSGSAGGPYTVEFIRRYTHVDVSQLNANSAGLSGGAATASVATAVDGFDAHGVQKFDPSGNPITTWGGTPEPGQLDATTCTPVSVECRTDPLGVIDGVLVIPPLPGLLVKPKGSLLVSAGKGNRASEWGQSGGEFIDGPVTAFGEAPIGIAVDPAGHVYGGEGAASLFRVIQTSYCKIHEPLCPESNTNVEGFEYHKNFTVDAGPATSVAVDPSTEDAYVARFESSSHHSDVAGYDSLGGHLETFGGNGEITQSAGVAASGFGGSQSDVYVADEAANRVEIFAPGGPRDALTVARAGSGLGSVSSVPVGIACPSICATGFPAGEVVTLTASAPEHSSFVGWSGGGCAGLGACQVTLAAATVVTAMFAHDRPTLTTAEAAAVTRHTVILTGTVNPEGDASSCRFEYGPTAAYGFEAPCSTHPGSGASPVPVSGELWELAASTAYHYRLVSVNTGGSSYGPDQTFITASEGCASNVALCPVLPAASPIATAALVSPKQPAPTTTTTRALARAQKLAMALRACRKYKKKRFRVSCEQHARKTYRAASKKSKKSTRAATRG